MLYLKEFLELFETVKLLKKINIKITDNYILGTDDEFSTASIIYRKDDIKIGQPIYFNKNDIVMILKNNEFDHITEYGGLKNFIGNTVLWTSYGTILANNIDRLEKNLFNIISYKSCYPILYDNKNIMEEESFKSTVTAKASDGASIINIDNVIMTVYGSMYTINKKDVASMTVYKLNNDSFLSEVIVTKPKGIQIYNYVRYRSLL